MEASLGIVDLNLFKSGVGWGHSWCSGSYFYKAVYRYFKQIIQNPLKTFMIRNDETCVEAAIVSVVNFLHKI